MTVETIAGYRFSREAQPETEVLIREEFADKLSLPALYERKTFEQAEVGRGAIVREQLKSGERVVARFLHRGGFIRHFSADKFLLLPGAMTRPECELGILAHLRSQHVAVPEPIGSFAKFTVGHFFYRGMIVTLEVPHEQNLLLGWRGLTHERLQAIISNAAVEVKKMLGAGVWHRDLHLGNFLYDSSDRVTLIDFDKALFVPSRPEFRKKAAALIAERFVRSARKHGFSRDAERIFLQGMS